EAGLELLRNIRNEQRAVDACRQRAQAYRDNRKKLTRGEQQHVGEILADAKQALSLNDALGLADPSKLTKPVAPQKRNVKFVTPATLEMIKSLDDLVHQHREETFVPVDSDDEDADEAEESESSSREKQREPKMIGEAEYHFPRPDYDVALEKDIPRLPLRETWEQWHQNRP